MVYIANYNRIRVLVSNNKTGDSFGITIPRGIAMQYSGVYFSAVPTNNGISLMSGAAPAQLRARKEKKLIVKTSDTWWLG